MKGREAFLIMVLAVILGASTALSRYLPNNVSLTNSASATHGIGLSIPAMHLKEKITLNVQPVAITPTNDSLKESDPKKPSAESQKHPLIDGANSIINTLQQTGCAPFFANTAKCIALGLILIGIAHGAKYLWVLAFRP